MRRSRQRDFVLMPDLFDLGKETTLITAMNS
jgi:hypothetical protein